MTDNDPTGAALSQPLHLVFGGELAATGGLDFADPAALDVIGIFPDYGSAYDAWKEVSQRHIDNALMRYFIVDVQALMTPDLAG
jgi:hypothetical protein